MVRVVTIYPHIEAVKARGRVYWYYRPERHGKRFALSCAPGDPEFPEEYRRVKAGLRGPVPGTLADLIGRYKADARWLDLASASRKAYERAFTALARYANEPVKNFTRPQILKLRDAIIEPAHGRWLANYTVTALQVLLAYAVDCGDIPANPLAEKVRKIRRPKDAPDANRPWTGSERAAVLAEAPWHILIPVAMFLCTGMRKGDVLAASLANIEGDDIRVRTRKRNVWVSIPVHPILAEAIQRRPACNATTICVSSEKSPWTPDGFDSSWHKFKARLEADGKIGPGLTPHGARHTFAGMMSQLGLPEDVRMKLMGHQSKEQTADYARRAPLPDDARKVIKMMPVGGRK